MTAQAHDYDVIVVGGRVAGAATAMLLAQRGHRVLVVERGQPGTDTVSTHALMRPAVMQLARWGLLDRLVAAGTPPVRTVTFRYGDDAVTVEPKSVLFAPRRTVLDPIIVNAARRAGAEVRFSQALSKVLTDASGKAVGISGPTAGADFVATARLVIGADGVRSRVARAVAAPSYVMGRAASACLYSYFDDDSFDGYEWIYRRGVAGGVIPTNGGALAWVGTSTTGPAVRNGCDPAARFSSLVHSASPPIAKRIGRATRTARWHSWPGCVGYHRQSWGPGWALVGDAAHFTDPLSAHGLTDALRDAELLAGAVDEWLSGSTPFGHALDRYQRVRDALSLPLFVTVDRIASFDWDLAELRELLPAMSKAMQAEADLVATFDEELVGT